VARVEAIARAVMQRLLHEPTIRLKTLEESASHGRLQLVRELFGLPEGAPSGAAPPADGKRPDNVRALAKGRRRA
jgi:glutamyl-tRNA reductase